MGDPTQYPDESVSAELVQRPASAAIMTAEQFDSTWRMSKALAQSQSFKDIGRDDASKALARILLGADLGMSPTQALMGIDIVKGNPQIRGVALGRMVRNSAKRPTPTGESYDYAVLDRGFEPDQEYAVVALYRRDDDGQWPQVEGEPVQFPTSVGPVVIDTGERLPEAVEAFKLDQARKRNLIKTDGAWGTQPEVMVVWRALSQLVRFYAPDVIGGVPVYTEADGLRHVPNLSEGQGSGDGPGWGGMEPARVDRALSILHRARDLGHGGLSDEAVIQQRLHGKPPEVIDSLLSEWTAMLDDMEQPPDADVVEPDDDPRELTFGGETFRFVGERDLHHAIETAMGDPEAMRSVAHGLESAAQQLTNTRPDGWEHRAQWYHDMIAALVREAGELV